MNIRRSLATAGAASAIAVTSLGAAAPAHAAPVVTGGLVNVTIVDAVDISQVTVQVPVSVAATVCDVNVAILLAAIEDTGTANCTAEAGSRASNR